MLVAALVTAEKVAAVERDLEGMPLARAVDGWEARFPEAGMGMSGQEEMGGEVVVKGRGSQHGEVIGWAKEGQKALETAKVWRGWAAARALAGRD